MAIHEQNYVSYDGPIEEHGGWRVFTRNTFGLAWGFTRTKLLLLLLWIPVLIALAGVFVEFGLREKLPQQLMGNKAPGATTVVYFLQLQYFSAALLMMASGCGAIAEDLKHRTFQLYFSRPVERWEYILGKFLGIFFLCSLVTIVPALLVGGLRVAYFWRTDISGPILEQTLVAWGLSVGITTVVTALVLGLSSLTKRTGYAVLGWIGVVFVPLVITAIVAIASEGGDTAHLWNLGGNFLLIARGLVAEKAPEVPVWAPILILVGLTGGALAGLRYRIDKLEGIA